MEKNVDFMNFYMKIGDFLTKVEVIIEYYSLLI